MIRWVSLSNAAAPLFLTDSNNLSGELPSALCCLPCLETLSLAGNALYGVIPQCMAEMNTVMDLEGNGFTPHEITAELSKWP